MKPIDLPSEEKLTRSLTEKEFREFLRLPHPEQQAFLHGFAAGYATWLEEKRKPETGIDPLGSFLTRKTPNLTKP